MFRKYTCFALTDIHSLLKFASDECREITSTYLDAKTVGGVTVPKKAIEYFEKHQLSALLSCQDLSRQKERRNRMSLILMYDAACRVDEVVHLMVGSLCRFPRLSRGSSMVLNIAANVLSGSNLYCTEFHPQFRKHRAHFRRYLRQHVAFPRLHQVQL